MSESVGSLNIEVSLQLAKMQAQFDTLTNTVRAQNAKIKDEFKSMTTAVSGFFAAIIPAVSAASIVSFAKSLVESGAQIENSANAARMSAENFQVFGRLAQESGMDVQALTRGLDQMEKKIADAGTGVKAAQKPFKDLGLDVNTLKNLAPEQQFEAIARAVSGAKDQSAAFADALDILGTRAGPRLLETLKRVGTEGFDVLKAKMEATGAVMSDAIVEKLHEMGISEEGWIKTISNRFSIGLAEMASAGGASVTDLTVRIEGLKRTIANLEQQPQVNTVTEQLKIWRTSLAQLQQQLEIAQAPIIDLKDHTAELAAAQAKEAAAAKEQATAAAEAKAQLDAQNATLDLTNRGWNAVTASINENRKAIEDFQNSRVFEGGLTADVTFTGMGDFSSADPKVKAQKDLKTSATETTAALKEQKEIQKESAKLANELSREIAETFVNGIEHGKNFSSILKEIDLDLVKMIMQAALFKPIESGMESFMGAGLGMIAGMLAGGGPADMGKAYIVGEQGPEVFVPGASGTVVPNGALGGGDTNFHQTNNFSGGVTRQDLVSILPHLVNHTKAAVMDAIRRGGPAAQVVGM